MRSESARPPTTCAPSRRAPTPAVWSTSSLEWVRQGGARRPVSRSRRVDPSGKVAASACLALVLKRPVHRWEGKLGPRDVLPGEESHFETFLPGPHRLVEKAGAIDQLNLADPRNVIDGEQPFDLDAGSRLLPGFALGAGACRLVELQKTGRPRPIPVTRLDRAPHQ